MFFIGFVPTCSKGVQPAAQGPHVAQDGHECGPTQNCKFTQNIEILFVITCPNYLMWPRDARRLDTLDVEYTRWGECFVYVCVFVSKQFPDENNSVSQFQLYLYLELCICRIKTSLHMLLYKKRTS